MKRIISIVSLLIFSVNLGYANDNIMGYKILKCFHKTAKFDKLTLESIPTSKLLNNELIKLKGKINFTGGFLKRYYHMKFIMNVQYNKNNNLLFTIVPTEDTASFSPNKKCRFLKVTKNLKTNAEKAIEFTKN